MIILDRDPCEGRALADKELLDEACCNFFAGAERISLRSDSDIRLIDDAGAWCEK